MYPHGENPARFCTHKSGSRRNEMMRIYGPLRQLSFAALVGIGILVGIGLWFAVEAIGQATGHG